MKTVLVAGDVCLDVVGISVPAPSDVDGQADNWRLTGETRTHFLLGGTLLLADWMRAAAPECDVRGPRPCRPAALSCGAPSDQPLTSEELLNIAGRLTRDEIVHSLLSLDYFRVNPDAKRSDVIRVQHTHGFSGPKTGEPSLKILPPDQAGGPPDFIVLDDTGNRFRRTPDQWPAPVTQGDVNESTVVVYKLHRPLPGKPATPGSEESRASEDIKGPSLWNTASELFRGQRLIIVSIDDLRNKDAPISRGLSWEQTALDLIWQLLNVEAFAPLRDCPHLIVRMGLDGALYWHRSGDETPRYNAWLIYDPTGIEGAGARACEGLMVGYGSTFTVALVKQMAEAGTGNCLAPVKNAKGEIVAPSSHLETGIKRGLIASRRLLRQGFGTRGLDQPNYPGAGLFQEEENEPFFGCQPVPIILYATKSDRGYWRLLDSIFQDKTALLHRAVALTATGAKATGSAGKEAEALLKQIPTAQFAKSFRTWDRREIENYRALYSLMFDYISRPVAPRPLSVAVFGSPGSGKSFGVKMVAKALSELGGPRPIETLTINLSQYQNPDQLADAFHLVRDLVLRGKIPLVFFDEFDAPVGDAALGWLRYFLAPMQDGEFLDRGTPHPIGQSIFVFAGGTCSTCAEFAAPLLNKGRSGRKRDFQSAKGPDFLSRLRGTLDVPSLDLDIGFDPYGPVEAFPCEAAILLRRAGILSHQLGEKAPRLRDSADALRVSATVLRALLHLPKFEHGNRSLEALLDMSHLPSAERFTPALLPSPPQAGLHANALYLSQLLATEYPYPPDHREGIAKTIHEKYVEHRKNTEPNCDPADNSLSDWSKLRIDLKESNRQQADHIPDKLHSVGLWFRRAVPGAPAAADSQKVLEPFIEMLARAEHDRWVAEKRRQGWIPARDMSRDSRNKELLLHNCLFPWEELPEKLKDLDRATVRRIPDALASAGYEIYKP